MKALRTIVALIALVCIPFAASLSQDSGRRRRESDKREAKAERRNAREHRHRVRATSANTRARLVDDEDEDEGNERCEAEEDGEQEEEGEHRNENRRCAAPPPPPPPPPTPPPPPPPPPPPGPPPTGPHHIDGVVYQEVDGLPGFDIFAGDLRVGNVTVELFWNGQLIDSRVSDADGAFSFPNLGITTYDVCVIPPGGVRLVVPAPGGPCGGNGYVAEFVSNIETGFPAVFGFVTQ